MTHQLRGPRTALLLFAAMASTGVGGCAGESPSGAAPGATRGRLVMYTASFADGHSEELYGLLPERQPAAEIRLLFGTPPELTPGAVLDVWGAADGDALRVARFSVVTETPRVVQQRQALTNGAPYRARKFAIVLVDLGGGVNTTAEQIRTRMVGSGAADPSIREYYVEASYGRQDLSVEVFGPIKYTMNNCETSAMATALRPMVPDGFDHYLWYMGSRATACMWSGLAQTGTPSQPVRNTWYNAPSTTARNNCTVLVQEPGHNFGMRHSSSMKCNAATFADAPNDSCTHNEYGDSYDPMGRACGHMNAYQKAYQGWFGGCNVVDVNSSGTFTLLPLELGCNGIQALQIKMPKSRPFARSGGGGQASTVALTHYYVEFRTPRGFDTLLAARPQVQIRVSNDIRSRTQGGLNTWLLDMLPATTALDGMGAGGSFTDPDPAAGIKITVDAIDMSKATVSVEIANGMGGPTCMDGTPLPSESGPGPESCNPAVSRPNGMAPLPNDAGLSSPTDAGGVRLDGGARPVDAATMSSNDAAIRREDGSTTPMEQLLPDAGARDAGASQGGVAGASGSAGRSGGGAGGGAPGAGGGAGAADGDSPESGVAGGCGCEIGAGARSGGSAWAVSLLGLAALVRARRRRSR